MPANYNSGPAPSKAPAPAPAKYVPRPAVMSAPARPVSVPRPVRQIEAAGAAKTQQLAPSTKMLPGPGISSKQAAIGNQNAAKTRQLTANNPGKSYAPKPIKVPKAQSYGSQLAAIRAPGSANDIFSKLVGGTISDVVNLPKSLIQSGYYLGKAGVDSASQGSLAPLGHLASQAAHSDALFNLITGHPDRALQLAEAHPLNAGLDLAGGYGAIGRIAGAVGRSGALGSDIADATSMARAPKEAVPGIPGTAQIQHYSPNAFTQMVQKVKEGNPAFAKALSDTRGAKLTDKLHATGPDAGLRQQVAAFYGPEKAQYARDRVDLSNAFDATAPNRKEISLGPLKHQKGNKAGTVESNAVPYAVAAGGADTASLDRLLQGYKDVRAGAQGPQSAATIKQLDQHIPNLQAIIDKANAGKLDVAAVNHDAAAYSDRQAALEAQKVQHGLHTEPELAAAVQKQYAALRIPGTHYLTKPITDPAWIAKVRDAKSMLKDAKQQLADTQKAAVETKGRLTGGSGVLADVSKRVPVHPVNDAVGNHMLDLRQAIDAERAKLAAQHPDDVAAQQHNVEDAQRAFDALAKSPQRLHGLVREDPSGLPMKTGPLKGLSVRPFEPGEIQQHMLENGANPSFIHMTNPDRMRPMTLGDLNGGRELGAASITGKASTGAAAKSGDWVAGRNALKLSQFSDLTKIADARMTNGFVERFGLKPDNGNRFFTSEAAANAAKAEHEATHGPQYNLQPVNVGGDRWTLIPKAAIKEYQAQRKLEAPGRAGKAGMFVNRGFRNTVLTMSPKLPIMHTAENTLRAGLAGATPLDWLRARSALRSMDPATHDRLLETAAPGGHGGQQMALDQENVGRLNPLDRTRAQQAAHVAGTPVRMWANFAHKIIGAQRFMESHAQQAVLGVHMRQTMQEMGHSWLDANTAVARMSDEIAHKYTADPALVEDAGRMLHKTMGQYNNFTARQRATFSKVAPFAPWYMNAARLVYHELPVGHPLKLAIAQDIAAATQNQWKDMHAGLPADMGSFIPGGNQGQWIDAGKFSPIGLEQNPVAEIGGLAVPQYMPAAKALFGALDPFGKPIYNSTTPFGKTAFEPLTPEVTLHAASAFLEGMAGPLNDIARGLQTHGDTLYNTSMPLFGSTQLKPNTAHGSSWERIFNPFHGSYLNTQGSAAPAPGSQPSGGVLRGSSLNLSGGSGVLPGHSLNLSGGH